MFVYAHFSTVLSTFKQICQFFDLAATYYQCNKRLNIFSSEGKDIGGDALLSVWVSYERHLFKGGWRNG
jgi:hypothetical protein